MNAHTSDTLEEQLAGHDDLVPAELIAKSGGWSARAQNYPVFSPTWFRYRAIPILVGLSALGVFFLLIAYVGSELESTPTGFYFEIAGFWLSCVLLCLSGRWFASLVYRRRMAYRKEVIGIVTALLFGAALATVCLLVTHEDTEKDKTSVDVTMQSENSTARSSTTPKMTVSNGPKKVNYALNTIATRVINAGLWVAVVVWFGGGLDLLAYLRQHRLLKDARERRKLEQAESARNEAERRLSILSAQIEPHFLFNTLAGVRSAIVSDPERGREIIDHLVNYLRATIPQMRDDANSAIVPLGQQLEAARAYLGVMRARLTRLSFSVECEPGLLNTPIPPLMLISLVENAIKHGIEPKPGLVHISVSASKLTDASGEFLELAVADNGVGFSAAATSGTGIGLTNIRERLAQLYGTRANLSLKALPEGGVVASIKIPLNP